MKIVDLKSAIIGTNVCLRVVTDKGIDGYSQVENFKEFVNATVPYYRSMIVGCDPTNVEDDAPHPPLGRVQALGQDRQLHRDGAVGYCGQGSGPARL